ncbi:hypothetical protein CHUAL_007555 [Chamberlinius hualienensis]
MSEIPVNGNPDLKPTKKPQDNFSYLFRFAIKINALFGFNLGENQKWNFIYNILYAHTLSMMIFYIIYVLLKSELDASNIQKMVMSLMQLSVAVTNSLGTVYHRLGLNHIKSIVKKADKLLERLDNREEMIRQLKPDITAKIIACCLLTVIHYIQLLEVFFAKERLVKLGDDQFLNLSQKYHIQLIYNVWGGLAIFTNIMCIGGIFLSVLTVIHAMFDFLISVKFNDARQGSKNRIKYLAKLIEIHRQNCEILKLKEKYFRIFCMMFIFQLTENIIIKARIFMVENNVPSMSQMISLSLTVAILTIFISKLSTINEKMKLSLRHLMMLTATLGEEKQIKTTDAACLLSKAELYASYVELDNPVFTVGGLLNIKSDILVGLAGLSLSYILLLYSKM